MGKDVSNGNIVFRQKHLNMTFFTIWIMVITTCQWIMVDMYLPALPVLKNVFDCSESILNVSLNAGIISEAVGVLFGGMISDKYGRKPIMLVGLFTVVISCLAASLSTGILFLIFMRGIAGLGSGAVLAITAAMVKDSFRDELFERTMTILQSVAVVGPIIAPVFGALLINTFSWRAIFVSLGLISLVTAIPMLISTETLPVENRIHGNVTNLFKEMGMIVRNKGFALFLTIMSLLTIPVWAYIAVSSYVYIEEFGLSNVAYSMYYAGGSLLSFLAPFVYMMLRKIFTNAKIVTISIAILFVGTFELFFAGKFSPIMFMIGVFALMMSEGIIRPLTMIIILEENPHAVGTASSLTQFLASAVGIIGSTIATLPWQSMVTGIVFVSIICAVISIWCWIVIKREKLIKSLM